MLRVTLVALLSILPAYAGEVGLSTKYTTTPQNIPVSLREGFIAVPFNQQFSIVGGLGKLSAGDKSAPVLSTGIQYNKGTCPRYRFMGKVYYFSEYDFGRKNYGGPLHFNYNLGAGCQLNKYRVGLYFDHISNGSRYEFNPAIDSINLEFAYDY